MNLKHPRYVSDTIKALGLDPANSDYVFDGLSLKVDGFTDTQIINAEKTLNIIALQNAEFNQGIEAQIVKLEAMQTPRMLREALQGVAFSVNKLKQLDADIAALRIQLK